MINVKCNGRRSQEIENTGRGSIISIKGALSRPMKKKLEAVIEATAPIGLFEITDILGSIWLLMTSLRIRFLNWNIIIVFSI